MVVQWSYTLEMLEGIVTSCDVGVVEEKVAVLYAVEVFEGIVV